MSAVMYGAIGDATLVELRETGYERELNLQTFLSKHPALLAGDQMNPSDPRHFVLIAAEIGIARTEGGGDELSLDHLFMDQDGIPTLVEVKRSTDTRLRREVIGQIVEYAAHACAFWNADYLRSKFEARTPNADNELQPLLDISNSTPEMFWDKVSSNLTQQRVRLVVLADKIPPSTQRMIEFLDGQMGKSEVFGIEVRQYIGGDMTTLVPRVLNPSILQAERRSTTSSGSRVWSEESFYAAVTQNLSPGAVSIFQAIQEWAVAQPRVAIYFGTGAGNGGLQITYKGGTDALRYQKGADTVFTTLWTSGTVEFDLQYLKAKSPFVSDESRSVIRDILMRDSTLDFPIEKLGKRPNFQWTEFAEPKNLAAFIAAMDYVLAELALSP